MHNTMFTSILFVRSISFASIIFHRLSWSPQITYADVATLRNDNSPWPQQFWLDAIEHACHTDGLGLKKKISTPPNFYIIALLEFKSKVVILRPLCYHVMSKGIIFATCNSRGRIGSKADEQCLYQLLLQVFSANVFKLSVWTKNMFKLQGWNLQNLIRYGVDLHCAYMHPYVHRACMYVCA